MKGHSLFFILITAAAVAVLSACSQTSSQGPFKLSGTLAGLPDTLLVTTSYIEEGDAGGPDFDVIPVKDNTFEYIYDSEDFGHVLVCVPEYLQGDEDAFCLTVMAIPGEEARVEGTVNSYVMGGSKYYRDLGKIEKDFSSINFEDYDSFVPSLLDLIKKYRNTDAIVEMVSILSYVAPDKTEEAISLLSSKVQNGRMMLMLDAMRDGAMEASQVPQGLLPGTPAPDFNLKSIDGTSLSLSSLRGKVVVLDFWGAWCTWCMEGLPRMKELYREAAGKFELVGMDYGDTEEVWKETVRKNGMNWLHAIVPEDDDVILDYGIVGFPTKVIIDADGMVVNSFVGESDQFYDTIRELLDIK